MRLLMTIAFGFLFFLSIGLAWAHYREPFSLRLNPGFIEIKPRLFSKPISILYSSLKQIRYDIQIIPGYENSLYSFTRGVRLKKFLYFDDLQDKEITSISLSRVAGANFNDLHAEISKLAPNLKWVYPD